MLPVDPVASLARTQFGVISSCQLAELGLDGPAVRRRMASGLLSRALPGVFSFAGGAPSWRQELMAACLWGNVQTPDAWRHRATAVVSHEAAAALHGLDGYAEGPVILTGPRRPQFPGSVIVVHRGMPDRRFIT